jgi:threonine synthase
MRTDPGLSAILVRVSAHAPLLERYRDLLANPAEAFPIGLGEGGTPLLHARRLGAEVGLDRLFLKYEGTNPTGSFKDRGMVLAVNRALAANARAVVCASTGNTSASAAAYAAAAGIPCFVILPAGKVARGKLVQAVAAGARLVMVDGNFDAALTVVRRLGEEGVAVVVNSVNPDRLLGQQTGAFEIVDELGAAPDAVALPVGNAGNITAYWRGFVRYAAEGRTPGGGRPRMLGFQAAGAAPLVSGRAVDEPETVATAIRIGRPASWEGAVDARDASGGLIEAVSDEEILDMQRAIAREEGIFCEPASAAGVAGVARLAREGRLGSAETVVCVLTGHGLKDPDAVNADEGSLTPVPADLGAIREAMRL